MVLSKIHVSLEHNVECCRSEKLIWKLLIAILNDHYFIRFDDGTVASWRVAIFLVNLIAKFNLTYLDQTSEV